MTVKAKAVAVVGILMFAALAGLSGTAQASVFYTGVMFHNEGSGLCMQANHTPGTDYLSSAPCDPNNEWQIWNVQSVRPDGGSPAYANVGVISASGYCIRSTALPWKLGYQMRADTLCYNDWLRKVPSDSFFAMTPARPSQGHQHYENLYNFELGVCMDGGFNGVYGFPKPGCNAPQGEWNNDNPNPWQVWDVYY